MPNENLEKIDPGKLNIKSVKDIKNLQPGDRAAYFRWGGNNPDLVGDYIEYEEKQERAKKVEGFKEERQKFRKEVSEKIENRIAARDLNIVSDSGAAKGLILSGQELKINSARKQEIQGKMYVYARAGGKSGYVDTAELKGPETKAFLPPEPKPVVRPRSIPKPKLEPAPKIPEPESRPEPKSEPVAVEKAPTSEPAVPETEISSIVEPPYESTPSILMYEAPSTDQPVVEMPSLPEPASEQQPVPEPIPVVAPTVTPISIPESEPERSPEIKDTELQMDARDQRKLENFRRDYDRSPGSWHRTIINRHEDHEILLSGIFNPSGEEIEDLTKLDKILFEDGKIDMKKVLFIDIGPAINNPSKPAITSQETAKKFKEMDTVVLDLPGETGKFLKQSEGNKNQLLQYGNIHILSGDGLKSLKDQYQDQNTNPFHERKRPDLSGKNLVIIRNANATDIYCDWKDNKKALARVAQDFKEKPVLYLYNKEILLKKAGETAWKIIGETSNRGFNHRNRDLIRKGLPPFKLEF